MSVIPAIREAEVGPQLEANPGQKQETLSEKYLKQKGQGSKTQVVECTRP
jgi:hypothetical protein